MAKETAPVDTTPVKVRVLVECEHGKPNDVVEMDPVLATSLAGTVDADQAAVEYAESLAK